MAKQRLDLALLNQPGIDSREKAQALILAGKVKVNGQRVDKPGFATEPEARIEVADLPRYVSRGGLKLEAALAAFQVSPANKVCLDIGTSTGGFTDCLLQHGALRVHAVDTGAGQIHWKLRTDPRVFLHENTNARFLRFADIGEAAELIVCDVSFISVTLLIDALQPLLRDNGDWIILVKPQFEVGRDQVGHRGIVRDEIARQRACDKVASALDNRGFKTHIIPSPILGAEGNHEYLLHAHHAAHNGSQEPNKAIVVEDQPGV